MFMKSDIDNHGWSHPAVTGIVCENAKCVSVPSLGDNVLKNFLDIHKCQVLHFGFMLLATVGI